MRPWTCRSSPGAFSQAVSYRYCRSHHVEYQELQVGAEGGSCVRSAPLLVGANSAGKSAVLQSILMVAQSVQSGASTGMFGLNGPLVNLGTYEDIQHADSGDEVFLSLEMYPGGDFDALYNGAIRWGALIASPGGGSRGSAVIKGVVLENGYDDFTLGLARQSGEMKTVHFIPSSPRKLAESHEAYGAYTGSLQCDEQHGTTGTD